MALKQLFVNAQKHVNPKFQIIWCYSCMNALSYDNANFYSGVEHTGFQNQHTKRREREQKVNQVRFTFFGLTVNKAIGLLN